MTIYRTFPGFTPDDWRTVANEGAVTLRDAARAEQWCDEAARDHDLELHAAYDHPFCAACERWDWDAGRPFSEWEQPPGHAEEVTRGRALRYLLLHGRPPMASTIAPPKIDAGTLAEILAREPEPPARVEGLIPWSASTLLTAKRKTGKTTLTLNLARSLLTGAEFLGRFPVRALEGTAAILNYEVSAGTLARWAEDHGIDPDRLLLVNLRGVGNPLRSPAARGELAELLRAHEVECLIVDTFGRAYTGKSQNDAGEVTSFLTDLDAFARAEVGARDLILTAHAGWDGERTRGSTALEDWPDSVLTLTSDDAGNRFLHAFGRDVDVPEDRLTFDPATRALTMTGTGSRKSAAHAEKVAALVPAVVDLAAAEPGITGYKVGQRLRENGTPFQRGDEVKALAAAVAEGLLTVETGARNAKCYSPTPTYPTPTPAGEVPTYPDLLYRGRVGGGGGEPENGTGVGPPERNEDDDHPRDLDERPRCEDCTRRLGASETIAGVCLQCHRVRIATETARGRGTA